MSHFPEPVKLPTSVSRKRTKREKEIRKSSIIGILIRCAIIAAELMGVVIFGSSALLMDAIASSFDVLSTIVLLIFVKLAARPPDREHPFGHGRYEPLLGLQLGLALALVGLWAIIQQFIYIENVKSGEIIDPRAWIIPVAAVLLLELCYQIVIYTVKRQHSPALAADAYHYRIDALTSLFAAIALVLGAFFPAWSHAFDHLGALTIGILMIILGLYAAKGNVNQLLDRVPGPKFFEIVKNAALRVNGVKDTEKTRIMLYGPDAHVDIDIEVDPDLSVEVAHKISQKVRAEIQKAWPAVRDVTVHIEPFYPGDH